MSASSENSVSWRKIAVFGFVISVPIVGYVVWKRLHSKASDEIKNAEEKREKKTSESLSASEANKPDIILSTEAEGNSVEQMVETLPRTTQSNDGTESNEYVISLHLEDNGTKQDEAAVIPEEVEGEFFLTLDLNDDADISNEATLHLQGADVDNKLVDMVESRTEQEGSLQTLSSFDKMSDLASLQVSDDQSESIDEKNNIKGINKSEVGGRIEEGNSLQTLSSFDKMSISELVSLQVSDDHSQNKDDDNTNGGSDLEGDSNKEIVLPTKDTSSDSMEKVIQSDQGIAAIEKEISDLGISLESIRSRELKGDTMLVLPDEMSKKMKLCGEDSSEPKEEDTLERETDRDAIEERKEENESDIALKLAAGAEMKQEVDELGHNNTDQYSDVMKASSDDSDLLVPEALADIKTGLVAEEETARHAGLEGISKVGGHSDSSDIEEIEEESQATPSDKPEPESVEGEQAEWNVDERGDHTTVVEDENDIVVIKDEDRLKTEEASASDISKDVSSSPPEDSSPLYLSHPYTRELVRLGCSLKTVLHTEDLTGRRGLSQRLDGGAKYARHYITDVKPKGLAHTAALRNGQQLCYISKIPTCGMSHNMVIVMIGAVNLTDGSSLLMTIRTEYMDEFGVKHEQCDTAVISFSVTPTGFCIKNIQTEPYRGRRMTDTFWNDTRSFSEERCWIQHMKSQLFVKGSGRQLTLSPLKNPNPLYLFVREAVRGRHLPPTPSCSTFWKEPQVMLAFPGDTEKGKRVQQFVSCMGTDVVGFLPLQQTEEEIVALNDKDPRLFYFISRGSHCYFMSVMMTDYFVAVAEGLQELCLRFIPEHRDLDRHADVKFTVKYPPS